MSVYTGIFCCSCSSVPNYCKKAFSSIHPDSLLPPLYLSRKFSTILATFPPDSEVYSTISPLAEKKGRFGYFLAWDDNYKVLEYWNLLKTRRIL